ncbi:hypothetical protein HF521_018795 [Silurus meridionalis]|uniref:Phosphoglycerate mutase n=2 Tax=Silurus meridionalis TaxID=175797 RepID=A0A8T0BPQ9_SILME|nr:hypothetical protein HF521_018795 [Silurus meridionalis]
MAINVTGFRVKKPKPKISASRRLYLKTKILKKASTLLEEEKKEKVIERERILSERLPPLQLSGLSLQDLQTLCKELHRKIDGVDDDRYNVASKVAKNEKEVADLSHKIFELKGKMKRPNLKRVRVSAEAMLGALLGSRHKESIDFKANLKTVKKEEEKREDTDWRKNVDAMSVHYMRHSSTFGIEPGFVARASSISRIWRPDSHRLSVLFGCRTLVPQIFLMSKHKLFLLRHGEGAWNKENRFCSWVDQKLSENGVLEAKECGRMLKQHGYEFGRVFTSILSRSVQTAWLVLESMGQEWVPITKSWRLNERHYGALIGLNRAEMALNHGEEQVKLWRRGYDVTPPPIDESHPYYAQIYNDRRYTTCDVPKDELPKTESLKEVLDRLLPYWNDVIVPEIKSGQTVLISAHGNSCRALLKHLEGISDTDIVNVTLPTGVPVLLELDENLRPVKPRELLGDQAKIQAAIKKVEDQGKVDEGKK